MNNMSNQQANVWARVCQECFHVQEDKEPVGELTSAYQNRKCKKCGSRSFDYGNAGFTRTSYGKIVPMKYEEDEV